MTHRRAISFVLAIVAVLLAPSAQSQLFRTYLASDGSDSNPCTLALPCRLLPAALAAVANGGEIWILDSANYNTATVAIAKSVSILAIPGAVGSVVSTGGANAITVNGMDIRVVLRNLVIGRLAGASGLHGIEFAAGAALTVDGCTIADQEAAGIEVGAGAELLVKDTFLRDNRIGIQTTGSVKGQVLRTTIVRATDWGIHVYAYGPEVAAVLVLADSVVERSAYHGLVADAANGGSIRVSASGNRFTRAANTAVAVQTNSSGGAAATMTLTNSLVSDSSTGAGAFGIGSRLIVGGNTITNNASGLYVGLNGTIESLGNNLVRGNQSDVPFPVTPFTGQ